jgi:FkbM family methyltransferase
MHPGLRRLAVRSALYGPIRRASDRRSISARSTSFAQFGEDREVVERLGPSGLYIDVGANHPRANSNTYLLYLTGWRGMTIEPIRSLCMLHKSLRPLDVRVNAAAGSEHASALFHEMKPSGLSTFDSVAAAALVDADRAVEVDRYLVPVVTLAELWSEFFGHRRPDFISIDTEGYEFEVLLGADLARLRPALVSLEFTSAIGDARRDVPVDAMTQEGYVLVREFGVNGLFERVGHDLE